MNGLITTFLLSEFEQFSTQYKQTNNDLAPEALLAFEKFLSTLKKFFYLYKDLTEEMVARNTIIQWYSYTTGASSGDCVRAKSKHYNNAEFSNVSINMNEEEVDDYRTDQGVCFGKVLMLVNIEIEGYHSIFDVALVQWYDFRYDDEDRRFKFGCPLVKLVNDYDFIPVESIVELVHIVPRFDKSNEYFVNYFIF
jgi:hypothetical protein